MTFAGYALVLGAALGFGLWLMVSRIPLLRRPTFAHRVAPHVQFVSAGARELLARRRVDPAGVFGVLVSPLTERMAPLLQGILGSDALVFKRLRQAGSSLSTERFRARQLIAALLGALAGVALGIIAVIRGAQAASPILAGLLGAVLGVVLIDYLLQRAARKRIARMSSELPTVLEFLTLSLSAGEALPDAIRRIAKIGSGELAIEVATVMRETAAGKPLADALEEFAGQLGHPGVVRLVEQIRGALDRGTPLVDTLRAHARDAREAGKRELLEAAGRKEITMLVPLVFGLLPITIAFALWPGIYVLQIGF